MSYHSLKFAAESGDLDRVRQLVEVDGYDPMSRGGQFHNTSLHLAARMGHLPVIKYLIVERGCDPTITDKYGGTPLHEACWSGYLPVVMHLVGEVGVDPNITDKNGETPLHLACRCGHLPVIKYFTAVRGCDPTITDEDGDTPLHEACRSGRLPVVMHLVGEIGIDPNITSNNGETPLHLACRSGHLPVVMHLIGEVGVDPNITDNNGETPLHLACGWSRLPVVMHLIGEVGVDPNITSNNGWTPLHFACCGQSKEVVSYLLEHAKCNPNARDEHGSTPITLTKEVAILKDLIKFGAEVVTIRTLSDLPSVYQSKPACFAVRTFIFGNPEAGKTTLTAAIKSESRGPISSLTARFTKVLKTNERTAGIVPHHIESRTIGNLTLYDLAGQREFYASHDALLQSSVHEAVLIVIVVDVSKDETEIRATLQYWISFISSHPSTSTSIPHVIIIGSHADLVSTREDRSRRAAIIEEITRSTPFKDLHFAGYIAIDCRYAESTAMTELRRCLSQSVSVLRNKSNLQIRSHCYLLYVILKYPTTPAITLGATLSEMETEPRKELTAFFLPEPDAITAICKELHDHGSILFLHDTVNPLNSLIVLEQEALLSMVTGTIFAPEAFKEHAPLASNTGIVPFSKLTSQFPNLDGIMIIRFLCHFEYCREIEDPDVLKFLHTDTGKAASQERFFFFPGLVSTQVPDRVWEQDDSFSYHSGWAMQCIQPQHFFTPRFLQVLVLRLAFLFTVDPHHVDLDPTLVVVNRLCSVWKNGIYWAGEDGAEALVEVSSDGKKVIVMVRCRSGCEVDSAKLRSAIIYKVMEAKDNFCSSVECCEFLLPSTAASQYPIHTLTTIPFIAVIRTIVRAKAYVVVESGPSLSLDKLIGFEPYAHLGKDILHKIFNADHSAPLDDDFLDTLARQVESTSSKSLTHFAKIFHIIARDKLDDLAAPTHSDSDTQRLVKVFKIWRQKFQTYYSLRETLSLFSIFAGRNPLSLLN